MLKIALYIYKLNSDVLYEYVWSLGIESATKEGKAAFQMNFLIICNIRGRLAVGVVSLSLSLDGVIVLSVSDLDELFPSSSL